MSVVIAKQTVMDALAALIAEGGLLDGAKVRLFGNDVVVNQGSVVGDFTPPEYSGYADSAEVAWNAPFLSQYLDKPTLSADTVEFRPTTADPFVGAAVYGYIIISGDVTPKLIGGERFDEPVMMTSAQRSCQVSIRLPGESLLVT